MNFGGQSKASSYLVVVQAVYIHHMRMSKMNVQNFADPFLTWLTAKSNYVSSCLLVSDLKTN